MVSLSQIFFLLFFLLIFICAVFHKKKWAQKTAIVIIGLGFIIAGIKEIVIVSETVNWLHNIWGILQIVFAFAFWGLFFIKPKSGSENLSSTKKSSSENANKNGQNDK
jgi:hypothetical protein